MEQAARLARSVLTRCSVCQHRLLVAPVRPALGTVAVVLAVRVVVVRAQELAVRAPLVRAARVAMAVLVEVAAVVAKRRSVLTVLPLMEETAVTVPRVMGLPQRHRLMRVVVAQARAS